MEPTALDRRTHVSTRRALTPATPWTEITLDDGDWDAADPSLLLAMTAQTLWVRVFEEQVLQLAAEGLVHGPAHSSIGQEGGAVGSILALHPGDQGNRSHRRPPQLLAEG